MSQEEYRNCTVKLLDMIEDQEALQRIYGYVNRVFVSLPVSQEEKETAAQ